MPALPTSWYCCPWEEMLVPHGVVVVIVVVVAVFVVVVLNYHR